MIAIRMTPDVLAMTTTELARVGVQCRFTSAAILEIQNGDKFVAVGG